MEFDGLADLPTNSSSLSLSLATLLPPELVEHCQCSFTNASHLTRARAPNFCTEQTQLALPKQQLETIGADPSLWRPQKQSQRTWPAAEKTIARPQQIGLVAGVADGTERTTLAFAPSRRAPRANWTQWSLSSSGCCGANNQDGLDPRWFARSLARKSSLHLRLHLQPPPSLQEASSSRLCLTRLPRNLAEVLILDANGIPARAV